MMGIEAGEADVIAQAGTCHIKDFELATEGN